MQLWTEMSNIRIVKTVMHVCYCLCSLHLKMLPNRGREVVVIKPLQIRVIICNLFLYSPTLDNKT